MKRQNKTGVVYSTNPDFQYEYNVNKEPETLVPAKQDLRIMLDSRNRKGKRVTLITGFSGTDNDLQKLGRELKTICGSGGTAKEGEILIQGDFREKVMDYLLKRGYKVKKSGG
ncbi:MAG: SUI1 family translation initiation factor [Bacteroidetes bacterium RBG_13_46_8]|nr:MAG: SUI1 family translation initiation factor [Bacteroidetes bacterium RBG_13_46_8]